MSERGMPSAYDRGGLFLNGYFESKNLESSERNGNSAERGLAVLVN